MRIFFILIGVAVVAAFLIKGVQVWRYEQKEKDRLAKLGEEKERADKAEKAVLERIAAAGHQPK